MATVITLIKGGVDNCHYVMTEPSDHLVHRVMGCILLREGADQFKYFKKAEPAEFELLRGYAISGAWSKFVQYVNDAFVNLYIYYEEMDLLSAPSAQKAVELAEETMQ